MQVNTKCDCILPQGRMHGRESRTQVAPQSGAMAVPGPEAGCSSKTFGPQSDLGGEVAYAVWRAGDRGLAQPLAPATQTRAWPCAVIRLIVQTRKRLCKAPAGLIGARAIRHELKQLMP